MLPCNNHINHIVTRRFNNTHQAVVGVGSIVLLGMFGAWMVLWGKKKAPTTLDKEKKVPLTLIEKEVGLHFYLVKTVHTMVYFTANGVTLPVPWPEIRILSSS